MQTENREPTISDVLDEIAKLERKLDSKVKRWDERFFQLSRDTVNFTRAVRIRSDATGSITAVKQPVPTNLTCGSILMPAQ
jgi:hypothetical protein